MVAIKTDSESRNLLTTLLGASALYLLILVIFYVGQQWSGAMLTNLYILRAGFGLSLLSILTWLSYRFDSPRQIGLAYLILIAGTAPFIVPPESFDQLVPLYVLAICVSTFVFSPITAGIFVTGALILSTVIHLFSSPPAQFNSIAWCGLFIFAIALVATSILFNRTHQQTRRAWTENQLALDKLPVGMYVANANGQIQYANSTLVQLLKYPSSEALTAVQLATTSVDPKTRQQWQTKIMATDIGGTDMQWRCYDGTTLWTHETTRVIRNDAGQIVSYEGTVEDISARKQSEEEQARYVKVMTVLYETTRNLDTKQTPIGLLPILARRAATLGDTTQTRLYLCGSREGTWDLMASTDLPEPIRSDLMVEDEPIIAQAIQNRSAVLEDAFTPLTPTAPERRKFDVGSNVAVPLLHEEKLIGVLLIHHDDSLHRYNDQDLHMFNQFAKHAAAMISNAQHLERARQNEALLASLNQAARRIEQQKSETEIWQVVCESFQKLDKPAWVFEPRANSGLVCTRWTHSDLLAKTLPAFSTDILEIPEPLLTTLRKQFETDAIVRQDDFWTRLGGAFPPESNAPAELLAKQMKDHALWLVPITSPKNLCGLVLFGDDRNEPSLLPAIGLYAQSVARALERLRAQAVRQQSESEFQSLRRVSGAWRTREIERDVASEILSQTTGLLNTPAGFVLLGGVTPGDQTTIVSQDWFTAIPPALLDDEQSIVKRVVNSGQPYTFKDAQIDSLHIVPPSAQAPSGWSGIAVPIPGLVQTQGVLGIALQHPREITHTETRLLLTIADILGMASICKRLRVQNAHYQTHLQSLRATSQIIHSTDPFRSIVDQLLGQITTYLKADAADLMTLNPQTGMLEYMTGRGLRTKSLEQSQVKLGEGFAGRAAEQRVSVRLDKLTDEKSTFAQSVLIAGEGFQSYLAIPLLSHNQVQGVIEIYHRASVEWPVGWEDFLASVTEPLARNMAQANTTQALEQKYTQLEQDYERTLAIWSQMLELRDQENAGHALRVSETAVKLARVLGIEGPDLNTLRRGAWLYDIGKLSIPDSILLVPRPLVTDEWEIVRKRTQAAYELLRSISYLKEALIIPQNYHERWDGKGYPKGLRGEEIPLAARIFAVVNTWEVLTSDRPYRAAWDRQRTRAYLRTLAGTQLDPQLVEAFLEMN